MSDPLPRFALTAKQKARVAAMKRRATLRIGIPRVLNQYTCNPAFSAYFESLGIPAKNLVYSDYTSEELYKAGAKRGSIDPCFPSKVGIPHVHNLLYVHHKKKPLDIIFFPMIDDLPSDMVNAQSHRACPTVTATPAATKAAFTKESDLFKEMGVEFLNPLINCGMPDAVRAPDVRDLQGHPRPFAGRKSPRLARGHEGHGRTSPRASCASRAARSSRSSKPKTASASSCWRARTTTIPASTTTSSRNSRSSAIRCSRWARCRSTTRSLERLFGDEVRAGVITHPMDITDAWKNSYSENTSQKVWAAKFAARHPNLVALELSSFKCGHDAPIYTVVEETVTKSGTPYFSFKDIDENKPTGSIKIRVETIGYFLKRYREDIIANKRKQSEIDVKLAELEAQLRAEYGMSQAASSPVEDREAESTLQAV